MEFHLAMGVPVADVPTYIDEERTKLRARLIAEEFFEVMFAMFEKRVELVHAKALVEKCIDLGHPSVDLIELADGLCDLDYVVEGTRLEYGINGGPVLDEVHAANMRKVGGPVRADGKCLKPEGWVGPDIGGVLMKQGWPGDRDQRDAVEEELSDE